MKKFIITDPCYIMNERQYDDICDAGCDFEGQSFPLISTHRYNNKEIVFHDIQGTPNGDGSYSYRGQDIGVDSGMLCIAECADGWGEDEFGATFNNMSEAQSAYPKILNHF